MNSKLRAQYVMQGKKADRTPVMFYRHFFDLNNDNSVNDYIDWVKRTNIDILVIQVDGYDGLPIQNRTGTILDFRNVQTITSSHPFIKGQVDRVRRISESIGKEVMILAVLYTPFNNVKKTMKYTFNNVLNINEEWKNNKETIIKAMNFAEKCNYILLDEYKKIKNFDGVMISLRNGGDDAIPSDEYKKDLANYDRQLLKHANNNFKYNIVHYCGAYGANDLSLWNDYDYKCLNWDIHTEKNPVTNEDMTIEESANYFKKGTVLVGGFDNRKKGIIYSSNKESIKYETKQLIRQAKENPFIISSDCSIDYNLSDQTINWIIEASTEVENETGNSI